MSDSEWPPLKDHPEWKAVVLRWEERRKRLQADLKKAALSDPEAAGRVAHRLDELEHMIVETDPSVKEVLGGPIERERRYKPEEDLY